MKFIKTPLPGVFVIAMDRFRDARGWFARAFNTKEFQEHGISFQPCQINNSFNHYSGTLRGMHYQAEPHAEAKAMRCIRGSMYYVVLDLRTGSPTFGERYGQIIDQYDRHMIFVPRGLATGYFTLQPNTEALYMLDNEWVPEAERGVRYDDPRFAIKWPNVPTIVSDKDKGWPDYV